LLLRFDEAETVATCVDQAIAFLIDIDIAGEIVDADNGSTDGSQQVAKAAGGRVVSIPDRHYASASPGGIEAARSKYLVIGDPDARYDFAALILVINRLRTGAGLVIGNRFRDGIMPGAAPCAASPSG
jgi:glycosyltransferase involved in cell wall biosynthesis